MGKGFGAGRTLGTVTGWESGEVAAGLGFGVGRRTGRELGSWVGVTGDEGLGTRGTEGCTGGGLTFVGRLGRGAARLRMRAM